MNKAEIGVIFDLDGVIVDTAHFHYLAWKKVAAKLGFNLTMELNEQLKGVSRIESLQKILDWAGVSLSRQDFEALTSEKNEDYLSYVYGMTEKDILPGVTDFLNQIRVAKIPTALGSASKNAEVILRRVGLLKAFDTIVDGNKVSKAKPDPEVFLQGARMLHINPNSCVVFEDSQAGIQAALNGGMHAVGVGNPKVLFQADKVIPSFVGLLLNDIIALVEKKSPYK